MKNYFKDLKENLAAYCFLGMAAVIIIFGAVAVTATLVVMPIFLWLVLILCCLPFIGKAFAWFIKKFDK